MKRRRKEKQHQNARNVCISFMIAPAIRVTKNYVRKLNDQETPSIIHLLWIQTNTEWHRLIRFPKLHNLITHNVGSLFHSKCNWLIRPLMRDIDCKIGGQNIVVILYKWVEFTRRCSCRDRFFCRIQSYHIHNPRNRGWRWDPVPIFGTRHTFHLRIAITLTVQSLLLM